MRKRCAVRRKKYEEFEEDNGTVLRYARHENGGGSVEVNAHVDPTAYVAQSAYVDRGATVGAGARIGIGSWVDHDAVVCAGAKSILDLRLTLEYLETYGVPVVDRLGCSRRSRRRRRPRRQARRPSQGRRLCPPVGQREHRTRRSHLRRGRGPTGCPRPARRLSPTYGPDRRPGQRPVRSSVSAPP